MAESRGSASGRSGQRPADSLLQKSGYCGSIIMGEKEPSGEEGESMPEAYTHMRIAQAARVHSGVYVPDMAAYKAGANGPDPLFAYRLLCGTNRQPLAALARRMHNEQCGRFLRTLIFRAGTPAQRGYALGFLTHCAADSTLHPYVAFQSGEKGQFHRPHGHAWCESALDSMFHEKDRKTPLVPPDTAAPPLPPQALAEVTQLLHDAIAHVYGETISHEALADAFHDFHTLRRLACTPGGGKRKLVRLFSRAVPLADWGLAHMTPAPCPSEGFAEQWENPYTHAVRRAGPEALCAESALLAESMMKAAAAYWDGRGIKYGVAMAVGDRNYMTGLISAPARPPEAPPLDSASL